MTDMWHLVHNQGIVRDDYIVIKVESEWLLCYIPIGDDFAIPASYIF